MKRRTRARKPGGSREATPVPIERRSRPRGRSARVRASVLQSAFNVLVEKGWHAFRVAEVAALAGVHKTSIYRRWGTKNALALEACLHVSEVALPIPDTGSLRSDLVALLKGAVAVMASPQGRALAALSGGQHPRAVAARRAYWRRRFDSMRVMFDRAVSRGEFPRDVDPIVFLETMIAPLHLRLLVTGEPLEEWPCSDMVDRLLSGYGL